MKLPEDVKTLLLLRYAPLGELESGSLALLKGTMEDGSTEYPIISNPDTSEQNYIGSLSDEDAIDDRHAMLGTLTKFRLILELASSQVPGE